MEISCCNKKMGQTSVEQSQGQQHSMQEVHLLERFVPDAGDGEEEWLSRKEQRLAKLWTAIFGRVSGHGTLYFLCHRHAHHMLGFTVAILADPDVILIDEVLGVGDIDFKEKSAAAMREKISSDKTVIIVTHNPGTLRELCDRVVLIENGMSKMEGTPDEILASYNKKKSGS